MTETYNVDDMTDVDWIAVINKPVVIGVYLKADDSIIGQYAGILAGVNLTDERNKFFTNPEGGAWFNPEVAYGLISFKVEL